LIYGIMDSQCVGGQTFSRWRMVQEEHIVDGLTFSLWRMVQVDRLLMYHGQLFSWGISWTGRMVQDNYSPGDFPRQVEWFVSLSSQ
jgi:hypothetical protein